MTVGIKKLSYDVALTLLFYHPTVDWKFQNKTSLLYHLSLRGHVVEANTTYEKSKYLMYLQLLNNNVHYIALRHVFI